VNKGCGVFDGYLMGSDFSSGLPPRKSLDKMTSNQASFVKSRLCQKREERRDSLIFKGFSFDMETRESRTVCSLDWSIEPA
jgi:hypothetical protein